MRNSSRFICILAACSVVCSATTPPAQARHFFRNVIGGVVAERTAVALIGASVVVGRAIADYRNGSREEAIAAMHQFRVAHPLAGDREIGHALKDDVQKHPGDLSLAQELAADAGVRVDLNKAAEKGEAKADFDKSKPPGRCSWERHDELQKAVNLLCKGKKGEISNARACRIIICSG